MHRTTKHILIVRRPIGEAPDWVRDAWIGIRLPLACPQKSTWRGFGVVSGPTGLFAQLWAMLRGRDIQVRGYAVNAGIAVGLVAESNPAAAEWWRQNTPDLVHRGHFVFNEEACEPEPE